MSELYKLSAIIPIKGNVPDWMIIEIIDAIETFADRIVISRYGENYTKGLTSKCIQIRYNHLSINATTQEIVNDAIGRYFGHTSEWLGVFTPGGDISKSRVESAIKGNKEMSVGGISLLSMKRLLSKIRPVAESPPARKIS